MDLQNSNSLHWSIACCIEQHRVAYFVDSLLPLSMHNLLLIFIFSPLFLQVTLLAGGCVLLWLFANPLMSGTIKVLDNSVYARVNNLSTVQLKAVSVR